MMARTDQKRQMLTTLATQIKDLRRSVLGSPEAELSDKTPIETLKGYFSGLMVLTARQATEAIQNSKAMPTGVIDLLSNQFADVACSRRGGPTFEASSLIAGLLERLRNCETRFTNQTGLLNTFIGLGLVNSDRPKAVAAQPSGQTEAPTRTAGAPEPGDAFPITLPLLT